MAPSFCAARAANPDSHTPDLLLNTAIFPSSSSPLSIGSQASVVSEVPEGSSSTTTSLAVKGVSPAAGTGLPNWGGVAT